MRYIGSKTASLSAIAKAFGHGDKRLRSLCDPFAGTCTVARHFKAKGWRVVTGDLLTQSYALQVAYVQMNQPPLFRNLFAINKRQRLNGSEIPPHEHVLAHLNALHGLEGFVTREYSISGPARRLFFTAANARRIDRIRQTIEKWSESRQITTLEKWYLLACLLEAADRVANTACTYYAYLKRLYRKARLDLSLQPIAIVDNNQSNKAHLLDAASLVKKADADVVYLDPPYNTRNYGAYYHLPETLLLWDRPKTNGKSGIAHRPCYSPFYHRGTASDALSAVIKAAHAKLLVVHYAEDGLIPHKTILQQLKTSGTTRWTSWGVRAYSSSKSVGSDRTARHRLYWCVLRNSAKVVVRKP
jgi:adenine-specific DNA-methyltransferase